MSRDTGAVRRPRMLERAQVGWPPALRELKDLLYEVYLEARTPSLDDIARDIAEADADDRVITGAPSRDTVRRAISEPYLPPGQADAVSVAVVLARRAAWDEEDVAGRVRGLWVQARMATGAGRMIGDFEDRLVLADLEVHPALDASAARERIGALPAYVPREFDGQLDAVVAAAAAGRSGIAVLVGTSSTGKTRALWEAAKKLPEGWRLWHPLSPTRADAALAELPDIAPRTVVWLNEAQHYLAPDPLGEQVAAALRTLLHDATRGPVLVLATLWPEHWERLARRMPDEHPQARELLGGHRIDVPEAFTPADLAALSATTEADPRLKEAAERAHGRQVTQYLAGVPVLMGRYRAAWGATRALIHAAMDARRLGAGPHIPLAWLADAAPGYLTDTEWDTTGDDWLNQALDYVTEDCNGIPGILTPVRTGAPRNQRNRRPTGGARPSPGRPPRDTDGPQYQLADFLDQYGRRHRAEEIPPIDFWTAAAAHAHPADLGTLGKSAWDRGLYRDSAQLHKNATIHGNPHTAENLVTLLHTLHPTDFRPAHWAAVHTALENAAAVGSLLERLRSTGAGEQVEVLLARNPAAHTSLDDPWTAPRLLSALREAGAGEQVDLLATRAASLIALDNPYAVLRLQRALLRVGAGQQADALLARNPSAHAALDDPRAVAMLLDALRKIGAGEQVGVLAARAAADATLDDRAAVLGLLETLGEVGASEQVGVLATRVVADAVLDNPAAVGSLLETLGRAGARKHFDALLARNHDTALYPYVVAEALEKLFEAGAGEYVEAVLACRPAVHAALDDPRAAPRLLDALRKVGAGEQVEVLLARNPAAHTALDNPYSVALLLDALRKVGAGEQVEVLLARNPAAHVALDDLYSVALLLSTLLEAGASEQVRGLATRAAADAALDNPNAVADLLEKLLRARAGEQVEVLLARNPAAHTALDNPNAVALLLSTLLEAGASEQVRGLATRAAADAALDDLPAIAHLLEKLRQVGASEQVRVLATRAAADAVRDDPTAAAGLVHVLREAGAGEQADVLATRLPAVGKFKEFSTLSGHSQTFRFGREPDGSAATPWAWEDLE
ncbi:hypothetical protein [Streptomyces virginiae]|uniref:hypothetical protein n=1 Tax=Streptomyces virginiae TaxID=1961 RepID=UPI002F90AA94|nr:hypothetical protein OG253_41630 [Streptomyces virginiae]